jgi:hypothetical protein
MEDRGGRVPASDRCQARFGWNPGLCLVPGLGEVDATHHDLVADFQRSWFASEYRRRSMAVPAYASTRRRAVSLAEVALEVHETVSDNASALRAEVRALPPTGFARRFDEAVSALWDESSWIPTARIRPLLRTSACLSDFFACCELPQIAYITRTVPRWSDASHRVREYAALVAMLGIFDNEHPNRWHERLAPALAAVLLGSEATTPQLAAIAWAILEARLPLAKVQGGTWGGAKDERDRDGDFHQDLRVHLIELARHRLNQPEGELLAQVYRGDDALSYLPHAATRDFIDQRRTHRRKLLRAATPVADLLGTAQGYEEPLVAEDIMSAALLPEDRPERPDQAIEMRGWRHLQKIVVRASFRHTDGQREILRCLLTRPELDPRDPGYVSDLAEAAGCSRETVSRYLSKLYKSREAIRNTLTFQDF